MMILSLETLMRLLDEHDRTAMQAEQLDGVPEHLFEEREIVERQLLKATVQTDAEAVAKIRYLAQIAGDGERSDGLDVEALRNLAGWMERRFGHHARDHQAAVA